MFLSATQIPFWNGRVRQYTLVKERGTVLLYSDMSSIPLQPTSRFFVHLKRRCNRQVFLKKYNLSLLFTPSVVPNMLIVAAASPEEAVSTVHAIQFDSCVDRTELSFKQHLEYKSATNDPYINLEWQIDDPERSGDSSVAKAWSYLRSKGIVPGKGVVVGIIDDGFDLGHDDLFDQFVRGYDFQADDEYPLPNEHTPHGTCVSGVLAAEGNNGIGVAGACPHCLIVPVRMDNMNLDGVAEVQAFSFLLDRGVDIISNSWGPADNQGPAEMPGPLQELIDKAVTEGRNGKGIIVLFAAGNGNESISDSDTYDGYAAYHNTIAVGAVNRDGYRTLYSDYGKDLDFVAPSCDIDPDAYYDNYITYKYKDGIPTTDVSGQIGYRIGDYEPLFCGTSSATPLAAGIMALVLSANSELTFEEVRAIVHETADKVHPEEAEYDKNGFSLWYGYGRINALAAVVKATERGVVSAHNGETLSRYNRDELPPSVDHDGKITTMTDEDSIVPPEIGGCTSVLMP